MKIIRYLFLILILGLLILSCERKRDVGNIKDRVNGFIETIDSTQLKSLNSWTYMHRGQNGYWQNDSIIETRYNVEFSQTESEIKLVVGGPERFLKDFLIPIEFDTSWYYLTFIKTEDNVAIYKNRDTLLSKVDIMMFKQRDPFKFMSSFSDLKNKYGIVYIRHYQRKLAPIKIYFSTSDLLTYFPDTSYVKENMKAHWTKDLTEGEWLSAHWNFRKLDKPIEIGG